MKRTAFAWVLSFFFLFFSSAFTPVTQEVKYNVEKDSLAISISVADQHIVIDNSRDLQSFLDVLENSADVDSSVVSLLKQVNTTLTEYNSQLRKEEEPSLARLSKSTGYSQEEIITIFNKRRRQIKLEMCVALILLITLVYFLNGNTRTRGHPRLTSIEERNRYYNDPYIQIIRFGLWVMVTAGILILADQILLTHLNPNYRVITDLLKYSSG